MKSSFDKLVSEIRACRHCESLLPLGPNPVIQVSKYARLLIVGQAPGRKVHETGLPFNDPSGNRLREWMGVNRDIFYDSSRIALIPMGFCYPGTGKSGDLPPRKECAVLWRQKLLQELSNIRLTLVIGHYAHQYHLRGRQKTSLTQTVRCWKDYWPDYIPLPHPSPRNNRWLRDNPWFDKEVLPAMKARVDYVLGMRD